MFKIAFVIAAFLVFLPDTAFAAGSGMPWESVLTQILNSITGPVAQVIGALAVILAGFGISLTEGGSGWRKFGMVVFGLTIAFSATTFFLPLFGFAGGATF